jgi:hypothetical protein
MKLIEDNGSGMSSSTSFFHSLSLASLTQTHQHHKVFRTFA